jgi:hypothetical protein
VQFRRRPQKSGCSRQAWFREWPGECAAVPSAVKETSGLTITWSRMSTGNWPASGWAGRDMRSRLPWSHSWCRRKEAATREGKPRGDSRPCFLVGQGHAARFGQDLTCSAVPAGVALLLSHRDHQPCSQDCSQATGRRPTRMDNSGISAQPTTGKGRSWTTCPRLRIRRLRVRVPPSTPGSWSGWW